MPPPSNARRPDEAPRKAPGAPAAYSRSMGEAGPYLFIGIQIAGAMLLFVLGGYFADEWLGTSPWLLILGVVLGMVAVVGTLIRSVQAIEVENARRKASAARERDSRG